MPLKFPHLAIVAAVAIQTIACHKAVPVEVQQLRWIERANPIADAKEAISKRDFKLRAVCGAGLSIPGVDFKQYELIQNRHGYSILEGTSDVIVSEEHLRLVHQAYIYAETYNRYIIQESNTKGAK